MKKYRKIIGLTGASAIVMAAAGQAGATTGTLAGTSVTNTATVGYSIGGVAQANVSSNTAAFVVDRKANMTVAQVGGAATMVSAGTTSQVLTFTVTNTTNSTQDFRLYAANDVIGLTTALNHTDNFGVTNLRVYVDSNGNGTYDPGVDTATFVDELAPDASKTVFVVADIPSSGVAGSIAGVSLTAVIAAGGTAGTLGGDLTASLFDDPTQVDTVFADGAGWADLARDGKFSAEGEFDIYGISAAATKTAVVISDPVNGSVTPKAIPGAVVEYCIAVKNTGLQSISGVTVADNIPTNTTYLAGSIYSGGTVLLGVCNFDGSSVTDASGFNGTKVSTTISTLASGATVTTRFRVTLN